MGSEALELIIGVVEIVIVAALPPGGSKVCEVSIRFRVGGIDQSKTRLGLCAIRLADVIFDGLIVDIAIPSKSLDVFYWFCNGVGSLALFANTKITKSLTPQALLGKSEVVVFCPKSRASRLNG